MVMEIPVTLEMIWYREHAAVLRVSRVKPTGVCVCFFNILWYFEFKQTLSNFSSKQRLSVSANRVSIMYKMGSKAKTGREKKDYILCSTSVAGDDRKAYCRWCELEMCAHCDRLVLGKVIKCVSYYGCLNFFWLVSGNVWWGPFNSGHVSLVVM